MFTIEIREDRDNQGCFDVTLKYDDGSVSFELEPEYPEAMRDTDLDNPQVFGFDSGPCNGEFFFSSKKDCFVFAVAKYGDGNGGSLTVSIKKTEKNVESLMDCLRQWKAAMADPVEASCA